VNHNLRSLTSLRSDTPSQAHSNNLADWVHSDSCVSTLRQSFPMVIHLHCVPTPEGPSCSRTVTLSIFPAVFILKSILNSNQKLIFNLVLNQRTTYSVHKSLPRYSKLLPYHVSLYHVRTRTIKYLPPRFHLSTASDDHSAHQTSVETSRRIFFHNSTSSSITSVSDTCRRQPTPSLLGLL
jgi:hypothetical protein